MKTKLAQVLDAMAADDWAKAFSIASKFGDLGAQEKAIMRAQAVKHSADFYRQLGRDPEKIIEEGKAAMRERFSGGAAA